MSRADDARIARLARLAGISEEAARRDDELCERLAVECFGAPTAGQDKGHDKGRGDRRQKPATSREEHKREEGRGKKDSTAALTDSTLRDNTGNEPETRALLGEYDAGELEPVVVELGAMPGDASAKAIRVAAEMRLAMGLRARVGDRRPLPFSTPFVCERLGWGTNYRKASAAIRELEAAGVVCCVGELPPQCGRGRGTKLYASPLPLGVGAGADESDAVTVEAGSGVEAEPVREGVDELLVGHAVVVGATGERASAEVGVLDERAVDGLVTAGDEADGDAVHATDGTGGDGGEDGLDPDVARAERVAARWADELDP
jgi:hypothetical protein